MKNTEGINNLEWHWLPCEIPTMEKIIIYSSQDRWCSGIYDGNNFFKGECELLKDDVIAFARISKPNK